MYKKKLQELCHRKRWGLPVYSALRDGPDHDPRFKASVSVNGGSFDCPEPCRSGKQAYNEAAKLAYLHFTSPFPGSTSAQPNEREQKIRETCREVQSDYLGITDSEGLEKNTQYKNQLQNYAKWKQFDDEPLYFNESQGSPHALNYKATVIVAGHTFQSSKICHTPEEAEHDAAKTALLSLLLDSFPKDFFVSYTNSLPQMAHEEGGLDHSPELVSSNLTPCESPAISNTSGLTKTVVSRRNLKHEHYSTSSPAIKHEEHAKESEVEEVASLDVWIETGSSSNTRELAVSDASSAKSAEKRSYLLGDIDFPEGVTVLPISDNKWVAVTLEFPNET